MGCLKLKYRDETSPLRVVKGNLKCFEESCLGSYRYGFNGMENINEVSGAGNYVDFPYRGYNPRIGRFFSPDPLIVSGQQYPWYSSYQFAGNTPIQAIDLEGLQEYKVTLNSRGETYRIDVIDAREVKEEGSQTGLRVHYHRPDGSVETRDDFMEHDEFSRRKHEYYTNNSIGLDIKIKQVDGEFHFHIINKRGRPDIPRKGSRNESVKMDAEEKKYGGGLRTWPYSVIGSDGPRQIGTWGDDRTPVWHDGSERHGQPMIFEGDDLNNNIIDEQGNVLYEAPSGGVNSIIVTEGENTLYWYSPTEPD